MNTRSTAMILGIAMVTVSMGCSRDEQQSRNRHRTSKLPAESNRRGRPVAPRPKQPQQSRAVPIARNAGSKNATQRNTANTEPSTLSLKTQRFLNVTQCPHCKKRWPHLGKDQDAEAIVMALTTTLTLGQYRFVSCGHGDSMGTPAFSIYRGNRLLTREKHDGWRVSFVKDADEAGSRRRFKWLRPGADATGDGKPNLVLFVTHTSAAGSIEVFQLGKRFRKVFSGGLSGTPEQFRDLDKDGIPELEVWTFGGFGTAKWETLGSSHPVRVVLKFGGGRYRVLPSAMRKPQPPAAELAEEEKLIRNAPSWPKHFIPSRFKSFPPEGTVFPKLIGYMLTLIFTGHARRARQFLDSAWSPQNKHKSRFLRWFKRNLRRDPYWQKLRKQKAFSNL